VTFRHRAGVSPYTSSFDFAETCVFGKQSLGPFHCGPLGLRPRRPFTLPGRPFSRSYGAILPSSFSRVLPIALVFSTRPPVSVLVRARATSLEAFLGGMAFGTSPLSGLGIPSQSCPADLPTGPPTRLPLDNHRQGSHSLPRPPIGGNGGYVVQEYQPVVHRLRLSASA
jgi:hypothetical protein